MNPWIPIIATYGLKFALELKKLLEESNDPTSGEFLGLIEKYGTETLMEKLNKLKGQAQLPGV